ncbi:peptidyl-prolyl cis-trans isomerase CYP59-like [Beta vulgaris subsp. vulgaris]|uniref:peptidyl-prolyl cis-trans isomerase CYP59-like n=1 Tax=Beta vulgaris subsp. vulgaris TaxID=3555 RepID=UPI0020368211|nr:peptidyl-prolyl cis-trans isomerase CYP59-like [Beta vulgaris subsp. vulgaris]
MVETGVGDLINVPNKAEVDNDATARLEDDEEVIRTKEAHSRASVLEIIGDIPDADLKPPENVLFVRNLNSVTEDEDLHIIFSRFGTVKSVDIIRDYETNDSLGYGFIEFESKDACERAYFGMDGTLIDDRRIQVDFSQSVSKQWHQYKRQGTRVNDSSTDRMILFHKRTSRSSTLGPKRNHESFARKARIGGQRVSSKRRTKRRPDECL